MMQQEKQENALEEFIQRFNDENREGSQDEPEEIYHMYPVPGGMVILKEEPEDQSIDASPPQHKPSSYFTYTTVLFAFLLPLLAILFQLYLMYSPPIATVTIIPEAKQINFIGTLQMGRLVNPITLSQSATTGTTGKGHQNARAAQGTITFYNGQFSSQTVPAGTMLTGTDGVQVITDQVALIPAGNPPSYGQVTIAAHAVQAGSKGNILAYDINVACCFASVLAKNQEHFTGGLDERNYQTVAKADIANTATPLKTTLVHSLQGALQGQLKPNEQLFLLPCTPTIASDRQPGEEAATVTVTVSQTCSAAAYNTDTLYAKAQALLSHLAVKKIGAGYSLLGQAHVTITRATVNQQKNLMVLSITAQGTFVYVLSNAEQEHMKKIIAGKTEQEAMQLLASVKGMKSVSLAWDENTRLPKDTNLIHFVCIYSG